jgi:hypothetical protein
MKKSANASLVKSPPKEGTESRTIISIEANKSPTKLTGRGFHRIPTARASTANPTRVSAGSDPIQSEGMN